MTDREFLELAAKAAGIEHAICYEAYPEDGFPTAYVKIGKNRYWNPLTDDGDALRLAVKLYISIDHAIYDHLEKNLGAYDDQYAATRLAIVREAAAIAQRMP